MNLKSALKKSRGYSVLEIVAVVIIVMVIAGLAIPRQVGRKELAIGKNAEANLLAIYAAQKRYLLDNGVFYGCCVDPGGGAVDCSQCTYDNINNHLNILILNPIMDSVETKNLFTYTICATECDAGGNSYIARATRSNIGPCKNKVMRSGKVYIPRIEANKGKLNDTSNLIKNCKYWW